MRSLQGAWSPQAQHHCLICLQDRPQAGAGFVTVLSCLYVQKLLEASSGSSGHQVNTMRVSLSLPPQFVVKGANESPDFFPPTGMLQSPTNADKRKGDEE